LKRQPPDQRAARPEARRLREMLETTDPTERRDVHRKLRDLGLE
jgi:hypothetical protein